MNFEQVYTELKKANRTVHSAYDNADLNKDAELFIAELADDIASAACNHCRGKIDVFDATHVIRLFIKGRLNAMLINGEITFPKLYAEAVE